MDYVPIIVACIATVGAILVAIIQQFRKENSKDHAIVMNVLERVSHTVDRVEGKVDSHLDWHIKEANNGRAIRRNKTGSRKAS
jgi:hypothetical protein